MFLSIGNRRNLRTSDIVGIFDLDSATRSSVTKKYLSGAERDGVLYSATEDIPKSFVVAAKPLNPRCFIGCRVVKRPQEVYFSQLAAATLVKRNDGFPIGDFGSHEV